MVNEILAETKGAMNKALEALQKELSTIRTGRANPALLETLRVGYYGSQVPISQVANVGIPEPRLITIQPWDKTVFSEIEKAIQTSNLGLTPSNDGTVVRLPIPQLTEERRKELVKVVRQQGEDGRVSVRNARRASNDLMKEAEKEGEVPEDDSKRGQDQIQKLTDEYVAKIETLLNEKEEEIMEV